MLGLDLEQICVIDLTLFVIFDSLTDERRIAKLVREGIVHLQVRVLLLVEHVSVLKEVLVCQHLLLLQRQLGVTASLAQTLAVAVTMTMVTPFNGALGSPGFEHHQCSY